MTQVSLSKPGHHWFRWCLVTFSATSYYLYQCWHIVNWTLENQLQRNLNRNSDIFIQENAVENVFKMTTKFSRPECFITYKRKSATQCIAHAGPVAPMKLGMNLLLLGSGCWRYKASRVGLLSRFYGSVALGALLHLMARRNGGNIVTQSLALTLIRALLSMSSLWR